MDVPHGTWIPDAPGDFARAADFCLGAKTLPAATPGRAERHPFAREDGGAVGPTLLGAPTSVLGNWHKEAAKFTASRSVSA